MVIDKVKIPVVNKRDKFANREHYHIRSEKFDNRPKRERTRQNSLKKALKDYD